MFKIGDFSKLAQVSVKALRHYGKLGLLKPAWIDRFSGYRYYTAEQLPRLNRILALKDLGFSLEQIQRLLREDLPAAELRGMMRMKQAELGQHLQAEQVRLERVEERLRQIEQEGTLPAYEVVLKSVPAQRVAGVRQVIPGMRNLPNLFAELDQYLRTQNIDLEALYTPLAIYYDAEFSEQGIDVEAAAPLSRKLPGTRRVVVHELPAAEVMACTVHHGAYENLHTAYNALLNWIETNGYRSAGHNREVYLENPKPGATTAQPVTEVQLPVQKKPTLFTIPMYADYIRQEKDEMEPKIVSKAAFTAVGMLYHGKNENNEISQMWQKFNPRMQEIQKIEDGAFGICGQPEESGAFKYLAGFAVSSAESVPPGMVTWEVPAQKYAVFPCTLPTLHATYKHAFEAWLPKSGYKYTHGPDFEYYDESFDPEKADSVLHIYIPIE
jgi:predicted transcriptional regulator YdeE